MKGRRWHWIDGTYATGTILVILGHSHSVDWTTFYRTPLERMILFIYLFHMPMFFCIAGFLFSNSGSRRCSSYGIWLYRKALRLLTPYIVLTILTVFPKYFLEHHGFQGLTLQFLLQVFLIPRANVWGHFWFMPVLLECYGLYGFLFRAVPKNHEQTLWRLLLVFTALLYLCPVTIDWFGISDFCRGAVYFAVGGAAYKRIAETGWPENTGISWLPRAAGPALAALIPASIYILAPEEVSREGLFFKMLGMAAALLMVMTCSGIGARIGRNPLAVWISRHALSMYIFAWPFQYSIMLLCAEAGAGWLLTALLMFAAGIILPVLFIILYERMHFLRNPFFDLVAGIQPAAQTESTYQE